MSKESFTAISSEEIKLAMEGRRGVYPDQLTREELRKAGCSDLVCIVPSDFNERVSHMGNMLAQMLTNTPKDDNLRAIVGKLCQSLSYMLNSASWRDGKLYDFDLDEVKRKLGRLTESQKL